jgi:Spherulation-specific family 4
MERRRFGTWLGLFCVMALALATAVPADTLAHGWFGGFPRRGHGHRQQPQGQDELIPLYDGANSTEWAQACSQANGANGGSWIVANAATESGGPGSEPSPALAEVIQRCYQSGRASVIGYVWTDYGEGGEASIASIEQQIDEWYAYYPGEIAGVFFDGVADEVPGTTTSNESFYRTLASYVHTHEGDNDEVVFNFGQNPESDWMLNGSEAENADIVVTFEGTYDTPGENPLTSWTQASWELRYPAEDFAALIHGAPEEEGVPEPASACSALAKQNLGYVYASTSYNLLSPYFGELAREARGGGC